MLPDEVRVAVRSLERELADPEDCAAWDTIKAHLLAREAEVERLQDSVNALGLQGAEFMGRCERAEALLREISDRTAAGTDFHDLAVRIRAHLSENSRGNS